MEHFPFIAYMRMLLLGGADEAAATEGEKLRGAAVWAEFIKFVRARRGPYYSPVGGRTDGKLLRLACKLFPRGPPKEGDSCLSMRAFTETELADLYRQLLGRSVRTPLIRIWVGGGVHTISPFNAIRSIFYDVVL